MAGTMLDQPMPHLVLNEAGRPVDHLGFRPSHLPAHRFRACQSFAEAVEAVWEARVEAVDAEHTELAQRKYAEERRKLERRRSKLEADLEQALRADDVSRQADLIMAHLERIPGGADEVNVVDWFDSQQREIAIRLDPTRPAAEQAERLYRRARKLRVSTRHVRTRLAETIRALEQLEPHRESDFGHSETEPMGERGPAIRASRRAQAPGDAREQIHPRRYRTRDGGWLALVGRNERENDILSLRVAAPDDVWFHAQGSSGSHVVLRLEGRGDSPSRRALAEVAALAAYWSKQRGSSKVGVSYTLAKHVSKPRGAKPGTVTIRREKLLVVPPALLPLADKYPGEDREGARR
jgi:predicted ribosome quality control (RQC) complex YloA/Tae2 family protein